MCSVHVFYQNRDIYTSNLFYKIWFPVVITIPSNIMKIAMFSIFQKNTKIGQFGRRTVAIVINVGHDHVLNLKIYNATTNTLNKIWLPVMITVPANIMKLLFSMLQNPKKWLNWLMCYCCRNHYWAIPIHCAWRETFISQTQFWKFDFL